MGNDVHQIEAETKGIQVTTNNQKLLLTELEGFISSLRVPAFVIEVLQSEGLDTADGVKECEKAVDRVMSVIKYKNDGKSDRYILKVKIDLNDMAATRERISLFQTHVNNFSDRLTDHLRSFFASQATFYMNNHTRISQRNGLKLTAHETTETKLYKFINLLAWLKDIDARKHYDLQMVLFHFIYN